MFKNVLYRVPLIVGVCVALAVVFFATQNNTEVSAATELRTVYPTALNTYLTNPGIGWQADAGKSHVLPETVAYVPRSDISWSVLNPSSGVYNWTVLDNHILAAIAAQKQVSFRVYTMRGEEWGGHQVPQWVVNSGAVILNDGSPDYSNCTYQNEWGRFVDVLRQRYDGVSQIAYIDISGYGNFNEWNWLDNQTLWEDNPNSPTTLDGKARDRLAFMFIGGSNSQHTCRNANGSTQTVSYSYTGFRTTQLIMPYAGIRQSMARVISLRSDVGIRYDCLGKVGSGTASDGLMSKIGTQINATWSRAPIMYEFCGNGAEEPYMTEAETLLRASHGSLVNDTLDDPRDATRMTALMLNVGYRYRLDRATFNSIVPSGGAFTMEMSWRNTGYAPSYPRMGQSFSLHVYLVNAQGTVVLDQIVPATINTWLPAAVLPGTPPENIISTNFNLPTLPNGTYNLQVAIIEARTGRPINIAIAGRDNNGRYSLSTITVGSTTATATPIIAPTMTSTPRPTNTPVPSATTIGTLRPTNTPVASATMTSTIRPTSTAPSNPTTVGSATVRPTNTPFPTATMTSTPRPTNTLIPPTATRIPPTATRIPPTATLIPPTATRIPPTATLIPPTPTRIPPTATLIPPTPIPVQIHVAQLNGWSPAERSAQWDAYAQINVHNSSEQPVANVTVSGTWSIGNTPASCVTDASGSCTLVRNDVHRNREGESIVFTISNLSHASYPYAPQANHAATSVTVQRTNG
jgi:hypothetical protein